MKGRAALARALVIAGLGAMSCKPDSPPAPASTTSSSEPASLVSARRPVRKYYLTHTAQQCEVSFVDPASVSPVIPTPCPVDLEVGERLRIAGKTCMRESDDASRVLPVVCPDPLTNLEKRERGELPVPGRAAGDGRDGGAAPR